MFATLLSNVYAKSENAANDVDAEEKDYYYPQSESSSKNEFINDLSIYSHKILLAGSEYTPKCIPYLIHICPLTNGINLLSFLEIGKTGVSSNLYDSFVNLHNLETVQIQRDIEILKPAVEEMDMSIKKLIDNLKKTKGSNIEAKYKILQTKWDYMKKNFIDYMKNRKEETITKAESNAKLVLDLLKDLLMLTSRGEDILETSSKFLPQVVLQVKNELELYNAFFVAKALKNFSLGSYPFSCYNKCVVRQKYSGNHL